MMTLKDLSNNAIKAFLGCSTVHASRIKSGVRNVPKSKRHAFSERFNIPIEQLSKPNQTKLCDMTEREPIPKVNCGKCTHFIPGNKNNACAKLEEYRAKGANIVMLRQAFVELGSTPFLPDALRICLKYEVNNNA